jgi:hypothetical protein
MVKFSTTFFVTLVVVAPALAIPANMYHKRDATEQNIYQRTSEPEVETLASREPFFGLLMNIAKIGIKVGTKAAKGAKKIHSAHNKYNNRHKRDLDEESLTARAVHDEDIYARAFAGELTERQLQDLTERDPFFGLLLNLVKTGIKLGTKAAKGAKKIHSAHNKYKNRHRRDLDEESLAARELEEELEAREFDAEFDLRSNIEDLD